MQLVAVEAVDGAEHEKLSMALDHIGICFLFFCSSSVSN